jgi:hypothetical protein
MLTVTGPSSVKYIQKKLVGITFYLGMLPVPLIWDHDYASRNNDCRSSHHRNQNKRGNHTVQLSASSGSCPPALSGPVSIKLLVNGTHILRIRLH